MASLWLKARISAIMSALQSLELDRLHSYYPESYDLLESWIALFDGRDILVFQ
jgi:hypothetical protein